MNNQHYLAVTALGTSRVEILEAFTKVSKQCGCNILESKLSTIGEECAIICHLAGTWSAVAKLEAALPVFANQFSLYLQAKRTTPRAAAPALPYQVQIFAHDRPGILNEVVLFFSQKGIKIERMDCETYTAPSNTLLTTITLIIYVPPKHHLATLRDRFMNYCEELNLDAVMEPFKNA